MQRITKEQYLAGVINSIEHKYPLLRQRSKGPTFALQYLGTAFTLHKKSGFPMEEAQQIYEAFHTLYEVSGQFNKKTEQHMIDHGYVNCAFGLRLHTPIISQTVMGNSKTPKEAEAEVRSANNAVTQSWGMLLNRAMIATNNRIEQAGLALQILPINMIHDAGYFLVRKDSAALEFLNTALIEEMEWNDHDAIRSEEVPMRATLEIGKSWDKLTPLPNKATIEQINDILSTIP